MFAWGTKEEEEAVQAKGKEIGKSNQFGDLRIQHGLREWLEERVEAGRPVGSQLW